MLKRIFLVWAVAILALWDVTPFVPSANLLFSPRPLLAQGIGGKAGVGGKAGMAGGRPLPVGRPVSEVKNFVTK
jgi:hypothetical protein